MCKQDLELHRPLKCRAGTVQVPVLEHEEEYQLSLLECRIVVRHAERWNNGLKERK